MRPSTSTPPAWITPHDGYCWCLSAVDAVASAVDASFLQLMSQRDIVMGVAEVYRAHRSGLSGARPLRPRRVTIIPVYAVSHNAINDPTPAMRTQSAVNFVTLFSTKHKMVRATILLKKLISYGP